MPSLVPLRFKPGVVRDLTDYSGTGFWYDCNWVRFRAGLPEMMGGWAKTIQEQFLGVCRYLISWTVLSGAKYYALGTNTKFYVSTGEEYIDVTPIRRTVTLGANPFSVTNASTTMTVTDVANNSVVGDYVTFSGASTFAGLASGDINKEFQITAIVDADNYRVTLGATPNATTTGGGGAVSANYQINVGLDSMVLGLGWGAGAWGHDTWGSDASTGVANQLRIWTGDTFGEDLVTNVRNGGIYYWDATSPTARMVTLSSMAGASDAPTVATEVIVSAEERHVVAFGSNPIGSAVQDPMFVRWSDTEDPVNWTPSITNSAGGYRLSVGTEIVGVTATRSEVVIFTDLAMYSMRWTGPPYTFNFQLLGSNVSMLAPNASISSTDVTYWMTREQFFLYDGRIQPLECPVSDYIFTRLNYAQAFKTYAFSNSMFFEVGWLYPSTTDECDSYVIYNYKDRVWYYGSLSRTAWLDQGTVYNPLATSADSYLYDHEFGLDDGSTNPPSPINAYIESSPMETPLEGTGEHYMFLDRLIPDVTFRNSSALVPTVTMTLKMRDFPGAAVAQTSDSDVTQSASLPVNQFTEQCFIRLRGRSAAFRIESDTTGVTWRLGVPRVNVRTDGRR